MISSGNAVAEKSQSRLAAEFWKGGRLSRACPAQRNVSRRNEPTVRPYSKHFGAAGLCSSAFAPMSKQAGPCRPHPLARGPGTQMPPGSAHPPGRAAMFTPSPKMSPSCSTISPKFRIDAQGDLVTIRFTGIAANHFGLDFDRRPNGVTALTKLGKQPVASGLDGTRPRWRVMAEFEHVSPMRVRRARGWLPRPPPSSRL